MMNLKINSFFKNYWILFLFLSIKIALNIFIIDPAYELHRDEFLYLDQANHLATGYISNQPFTAWLAAIIHFIGEKIFWIRFFPVLFGTITLVVVWLIIEELGGEIYSKILVSCALIFSVIIRLDILFQPYAFDILAFTLIFYFVIRYINTERPKWFVYLVLTVVLGFYNKYNILFLLSGLMGGTLLTSNRKIFINKLFYIGLLLGLILILPNIIWQINRNFPILHHINALENTQLDHVDRVAFLKDQILFFLGSLPLIVAVFFAFVYYKPFKTYRIIGLTYLIVIIIYTLLRAQSYYAVGLYPTLIAFGGVYLEKILSKVWKMFIMPVVVLLNFLLFFVVLKFIVPVLSPTDIVVNKHKFEAFGLLKWDGQNHQLPQDFADMLGWKEMADKSLLAYNMIPQSEKEQTIIFCDNYGEAGALNYYNRKVMQEAYSFNADYIYWLPRLKSIKNMLVIGKKPSDEIINMFSDYKLVGIVENEYAREKNTGIYILKGATIEFTDYFYRTTEEHKKKFDIF